MPSDYGKQPVELISNIMTMNSSDDPTALKEGEAQLLENIVKDTGVLMVRKGMTKVEKILA